MVTSSIIASLSWLICGLIYPNDNRAIPPIISDIEMALVDSVRMSIDSSNKRNGETLNILPYRNTKNGLDAVTVETIEIAPRLEAVTFKNIPIGANIISPMTTNINVWGFFNALRAVSVSLGRQNIARKVAMKKFLTAYTNSTSISASEYLPLI